MSTYTFLVRHIPCKIVAADFESAMNSLGLDSSRYEVSMPSQEKRPGVSYRPGNFGYGFVVCQGEADAAAFVNSFQGYQFENVNSNKRLLVEPSTSKRTRTSLRSATARGSSGSFAAGYSYASGSSGHERCAHEGQLFDSAFAECRRLEVLGGGDAAKYDVQTSNLNLHTSAPPAGCEVPPTRLCHSRRAPASLE
eukprot:TRINITY_DN6508_c0_g2_i1.p1 TRINITY_DN6508_c0_g2~~TRINITY_DN6508_c0_g2_i1.p1  ORF type:complete len:195 (-),score=24.91 TRINITY_DN6508_c0_g2_i1:318-902(-)